MSLDPRRVMPDVLLMTTLKLSNPIQVLVLVKPYDLSRLTLRLALRVHGVFWLGLPILRIERTLRRKVRLPKERARHIIPFSIVCRLFWNPCRNINCP